MQLFGPPSAITVLCIFSICFCYGCMYRAAFRVSVLLKLSTRRVNRTMGCYLLMFLLQLAMHMSFVGLTMSWGRGADPCRSLAFIITPFLIVVPTCINALFMLSRSPRMRSSVRALCAPQDPGEVDGTWAHPRQEVVSGQVERMEMQPPGCVEEQRVAVAELDCG